jgi:uncharacterized protein (DUF1697 family)
VRWVCLLRGVNVGGVTVRNTDLTAVVEAAGGERVRAVLASGNIVFDAADADADAVRARIEAGLRERMGRDVEAVVVPASALAAVAAAYPFPRDDDVAHPYVVFPLDAGTADALHAQAERIADAGVERVAPGDDVMYWRAPRGGSTTTPVARLLAGAAGRRTTTRNLRTVERLRDA